MRSKHDVHRRAISSPSLEESFPRRGRTYDHSDREWRRPRRTINRGGRTGNSGRVIGEMW